MVITISIQLTRVVTHSHIPLYGSSKIGYYYVQAKVGTGKPEQVLNLILDSGSNLTIFPCEGCTECRDHDHKKFDPSLSSTFKTL